MTKEIITSTRRSTLFLRIAVTVIGLGVLALCVFLLPLLWIDAYKEFPERGLAVRVVVAVMYISTIPFYLGIFKGWQILNLIDKDQAFSMQSVRCLKVIARSAAFIGLAYLVSLPSFYIIAENTDAPGVMMIGLFLVGMPLVIGVAVGILRQLLAEAVKIKSENDLTV